MFLVPLLLVSLGLWLILSGTFPLGGVLLILVSLHKIYEHITKDTYY